MIRNECNSNEWVFPISNVSLGVIIFIGTRHGGIYVDADTIIHASGSPNPYGNNNTGYVPNVDDHCFNSKQVIYGNLRRVVPSSFSYFESPIDDVCRPTFNLTY
jgi:hypothetical protein